MDSVTHDLSHVLIELGLVVIGLAILARIASRWGFSAIPLYLLAGLAFGNGGLAPLKVSTGFIHIGAEIGVLLLLFMLGVEYTGRELVDNLRDGFPAAVVDLALNFTPGLIAGLFLRWRPLPAVLLGGVTYVSSSGVIAKVLADLRRLENPETPAVLSILVLEDLAMAVYLPLVAVLLAGGGPAKIALSVSLAIATVVLVLVVAVRFGQPLLVVCSRRPVPSQLWGYRATTFLPILPAISLAIGVTLTLYNRRENNQALEQGLRLMSVYTLSITGVKFG